MYAGWASSTGHEPLYACSLYIEHHTLTGCSVGKYTNINRSCSRGHQQTPFWSCILMHTWLLAASPRKPNLDAWMTRRGKNFQRGNYTIQLWGRRLSQTNLAEFVKYISRVAVPCKAFNYASPSNSSESTALSCFAQTGRPPPASHGNGCPYWEPLHNALL